jgi:putative flippase GtrA
MTQLLTFARSNPQEAKRFAKFLVVGALGFVVDFGGFNLFHALGVGPGVVRLVPASLASAANYLSSRPEVIEQALSFCVAVLSNFLWNYFWLYPEARQANQAKKISKFIIVSVAGLVIGVPVYIVALFFARGLVAAAGLASLSFNLAGNMALVCRVGVLLFWNFFVNRFWTYRDVGLSATAKPGAV